MVANKEKEMEETGAALRRIPNGANLRANKKTVTILKVTHQPTLNFAWRALLTCTDKVLASIASQDKCIDLIRALDEKENQIAQVIWTVGFKCGLLMVLSFLIALSLFFGLLASCIFTSFARPWSAWETRKTRLELKMHRLTLIMPSSSVTLCKDQVALNLAHRCDELEHLLQPLKALSNDASSSITLGMRPWTTYGVLPLNLKERMNSTCPNNNEASTCPNNNETCQPNTARELRDERAKNEDMKEQLRQAQVCNIHPQIVSEKPNSAHHIDTYLSVYGGLCSSEIIALWSTSFSNTNFFMCVCVCV